MTREEAITSLSDTKVYVDGNSKEIQEKLFGLGFVWNSRDRTIINENHPFLYIDGDKTIMCENNMCSFKAHPYKEITAKYILGIDIEKECLFKPFDMVLVRDSEEGIWCADIFSHCEKNCNEYQFRTVSTCYKQCIPYEGNEHLIGTSNNPK